MRIVKRRFAGRSFNAVQVIPLMWRLKRFLMFAIPAVVLFYFYPAMYNASRGPEGNSLYYVLMLVPVLLFLYALSRVSQRVIVYVDPEDSKFCVVASGLVTSKEKLNVAISDIKSVKTETKVTYDKSSESGDTVKKTKTVLFVNSNKGVTKLWTYSKAPGAQKAARLVEELLKT
jgi:hypothetical protein